jgi:high-affinity nickel-transport protein
MPLELDVLAGSTLGTLVGMRHALEPDHLAAVSTLITHERSSARAAWVGVCWGFGHTLTLVVAGVALIVLRRDLPPAADALFELAVIALLVGFGLRAVRQAVARRPAQIDATAVPTRSTPLLDWHVTRRPLVVGALHGLAGSGALTAAVVAALPTTTARLTYLALFGLGSMVGMAALSGVLGWPLARLSGVAARSVSLLLGGFSMALGIVWAWHLVVQ